jgi:formate dehydrogenase maturation protein FdhE
MSKKDREYKYSGYCICPYCGSDLVLSPNGYEVDGKEQPFMRCTICVEDFVVMRIKVI